MEHFKRLTSAVVILPPLLLFLYYAPLELFLILVLLVVALSLHEYLHMLALAPRSARAGASYTVALFLVLAAYIGTERWMLMGVSLSMVVLAVSVMLSPPPGVHGFVALVQGFFGVLFIGWSLSHLVLLRSLPEGKWYVFFLCTTVWVGDSVAMYVGQGFGHYKLAPAISPGKTWEGAVGGVLGCALAAVLGARFFLPQLTLGQSLLLGLVVSLAAQSSDLSESLLKRYAGVKDSGELIPGHGGILDRIDSLLFATPLLLYTLEWLL
jgi:phosphatidate cytidylyltransferase